MRMLKMLQGQQQQIATHSAVVLPAISEKRGLCFDFSFTIAGGDRLWIGERNWGSGFRRLAIGGQISDSFAGN
ncbi:hypothetical protein M5K25_014739 [Dendrobium thyrsiflorum]|uniref:Uncharacterized protein n=1 Tax=Dendrobium thyrsiflorum TaxID=117978 RepID=A0ABD0UNT0_DENTH